MNTKFRDYLRSLKKEEPAIFTRETRLKLRKLGYRVIRQSSYRKDRDCPMEGYLSRRHDLPDYSGPEALLGTMFHLAMERHKECAQRGLDPDYWYSLLSEVVSSNPNTKYIDGGNVIQDYQLVDWAHKLASGEPWKLPMRSIVMRMQAELASACIRVTKREHKFRFVEGSGDDEIAFEGMLDTVGVDYDGKRVVIDTKSNAIWAPLIGKGSVKKQEYTSDQVSWYPQLQHYLALPSFFLGWNADVVGIMSPVNAVPSRTKVGDRADILVLAPAPSASYNRLYVNDMRDFYTAIANNGPWRNRPMTYGKPRCPKCPAFKSCIGDDSNLISFDLQSAELAYLADE